ncbi:unnamed protein product [Ectocarpus sp. CCAP 1310/34]|nr:unnamed protein product [Ectocarpus sp. CCAP 1310/34]
MGKFRGHQDKSRRGREKKLLKKKAGAAAGGIRAVAAQAESALPGGDSLTSSSPGRLRQRGVVGAKRKLKHVTYAKEHSVLIVGDGDFSFTRGVIRHRGTGAGVVATSLDSEKAVLKKYPRAETWLPKLEADGAQVAHSVDATRLEETLLGAREGRGDDGGGGGVAGEKKRVLFDRVVFNFPHTGAQRTHLNRNLIRDFFASTKGLVKCAAAGGEVHVTLKDKPPYSGWNVKAMARESELIMVRCLAFDPSVFPGYRHSTTDPQAKKFDAGGARTNVFCRARSELDDNVDESGTFPVIVRRGGAASSAEPVATANNTGGSNKSDDNVDGDDHSGEDDNASDNSDLFGGGGCGGGDPDAGLGSWDYDQGKREKTTASEGAGDDAHGSGGVDQAAADANGRKNRAKKKKTGEKGGGGGVPSGEEVEGVDEGKGVASNGASKRGMLQPPVQKKKAAKRRAQRKRKAAAAKKAAASTAAAAEGAPRGEGFPQDDGVVPANKAKSPKRKRGKYVVNSAKKRPRD